MTNPCTQCGACCASFRVDFHASERALTEKSPTGVPPALTVHVIGQTWRMRGTDAPSPRCAALVGTVGVDARCSIYTQRPGPCQEFAPYAALGIEEDACTRARQRHGLPPIS